MGKTARLGLKGTVLAYPQFSMHRRKGEESPVGIESGILQRHLVRSQCRKGEESPVGIERMGIGSD